MPQHRTRGTTPGLLHFNPQLKEWSWSVWASHLPNNLHRVDGKMAPVDAFDSLCCPSHPLKSVWPSRNRGLIHEQVEVDGLLLHSYKRDSAPCHRPRGREGVAYRMVATFLTREHYHGLRHDVHSMPTYRTWRGHDEVSLKNSESKQ